MQPEERDAAYLWDMLQASRDILEFTRGVSLGEYSSNKMLQMAVERADPFGKGMTREGWPTWG